MSDSAVSLIRSSTLSTVAQYAYAATAPAGARFIHLAGSCPLDADGATVAVGDVAGQAAQAMANLVTALADAGAELGDVVGTRVLVASDRQADLVTAWEVVRDAFGDHDPPSTLLGVTVLGYDDQLVEVEATAAVVDPPAREAVAVEPVECLVVVDMQAGFVTGEGAVPGAAGVVGAVDDLLSRARDAGALVIHLRNAGPPGALDEPGTATWELHRPPASGEPVVDKSEDDGFVGTSLARELEGVRRLAVCGVLSEMCVAATARGALARSYGVVLPHTAHATTDVPAGPAGSPAVPAALAARAAEWSLGDGIEIVPGAADVPFTRGPRAAAASAS